MQRPQTILVLLALGVVACLAQPTYYPYGPQTNVPETDLLGWRRCWSNSYVDTPYDYTTNITSIFTECSGDYLLYGCRSDGSTNLALLAAGQRSAVLNNTGLTSEDVTNDNGVAWYFYPDASIGFAKEGDSINKDDCDYINGTFPQLKLCWHTYGNDLEGFIIRGYRCGASVSIDSGWGREIWMPDPCGNMVDGAQCDDGNPCTTDTTCSAGVCGGGSEVTCDQCMECDPNSGCVPVQNGTSCSDGNLCTETDTCQAGECVGTTIECTVPAGCFNSTCNASTGQCGNQCPPIATPGKTPVATPTAKTSDAAQLVVFNVLILAVAAIIFY